jgi:Alpha/beta hydrolase family
MFPKEIDFRLELMPPGNGDPDHDPFRLAINAKGGGAQGSLRLMLHRRPVENGRPVLLLHGASAGSDTFLTPRPGGGGCQNLVDYLVDCKFEPWLLDWRSSKHVAEWIQSPASRSNQRPGSAHFNFDEAATQDIAAALEIICKVHEDWKDKGIGAVGFCMGGAILAQALLEDLPGVSDRLSHVVLMSLGLFYSMNLYGRLKAESRLLERVASENPELRFLDPRIRPGTTKLMADWPDSVEGLYQLWRRPYDQARIDADGVLEDDRYVLEMFNRISFMFGEPYLEANLVPEIHDTTVTLKIADGEVGPLPVGVLVRAAGVEAAEGRLAYPFSAAEHMVLSRCRGDFQVGQALFADGQPVGRVAAPQVVNPPLLPDLFGAMALHLHLHGAENLRTGQATRFKRDPGVAPTPHINGGADVYAGFDRLKRITLIGGALNRLWHRDCIDRMAAWLERGIGREKLAKHILRDFGHQDLLWGRESGKEVFPLIEAGLRKAGNSSRPRIATYPSPQSMRTSPVSAERDTASRRKRATLGSLAVRARSMMRRAWGRPVTGT